MTMFLLAILIFGTSLWLGLYLLNRDMLSLRLRYGGLGLVVCAVGWASIALSDVASTTTFAATVVRWCWLCSFLPPIFWTGTIIFLVPEDLPLREYLRKAWLYGLLPFTLAFYVLSAGSGLLIAKATNLPASWQSAFIFALVFFL